jgi:hypothetical protein
MLERKTACRAKCNPAMSDCFGVRSTPWSSWRPPLEVSAEELLDGITWSPGNYRPGGFVDRRER